MARAAEGHFYTSRACSVWRDRRWLALVPALLGAVACFAGAAVAVTGPEVEPHWLVAMAFAGMALTGVWLIAQRLVAPQPRPATVRVAGGEVTVTARVERRYELARERQGWITPGVFDQVSLLLRSAQVITFTVERRKDALAMLEAAGVDPRERAIRIGLCEPGPWTLGLRLRAHARRTLQLLALSLPLSAIAMHLLPAPTALGLLAASALVAALGLLEAMARVARPPVVTVGGEGLHIEALAHRRFVPLERIERAEATTRGVVLSLAGGEELVLPIAVKGDGAYLNDPDLQDARRVVLMEALRRSIERFGRSRGPHIAAVERHGRDLAAWARAAREALGRDYRSASYTADALAQLACSPRATREHRIGATLALADHGDPSISARLRVAARTCADPELEAALEAAARTALDEELLDRALRRA
jgi:hypothetical protein